MHGCQRQRVGHRRQRGASSVFGVPGRGCVGWVARGRHRQWGRAAVGLCALKGARGSQGVDEKGHLDCARAGRRTRRRRRRRGQRTTHKIGRCLQGCFRHPGTWRSGARSLAAELDELLHHRGVLRRRRGGRGNVGKTGSQEVRVGGGWPKMISWDALCMHARRACGPNFGAPVGRGGAHRERRGVPELVLLLRGDLAQHAAHDLAAAGLGQAGRLFGASERRKGQSWCEGGCLEVLKATWAQDLAAAGLGQAGGLAGREGGRGRGSESVCRGVGALRCRGLSAKLRRVQAAGAAPVASVRSEAPRQAQGLADPWALTPAHPPSG